MKRKKIGSTLIMVITICGAILMTGAAIVTMTVGDYKMKQAQSNQIHNLYGADSGLDAAYDIMVADFDAAGNYAGFKVEQLKAGTSQWKENQDKYNMLDEEDRFLESKYPMETTEWYERERKRIQKNKDIVINAEFQRSFKLFLNSNWSKHNPDEYVPNQLNNLNKSENMDSVKYVAQINSTGTENDKNSVDINDDLRETNIFYKYVTINNSKDNPLSITVDFPEQKVTNDVIEVGEGNTASPNNYKDQQSVKIEITSKFKTKEGDAGEKVVGVNERTLKASYNLVIPNYDDIYFINQEYKPYTYDVYKGKAITVFGNMDVKDMGTSEFAVDKGDVFVFGNKENLPSSGNGYPTVSNPNTIDKYKGGISLNGDGTETSMVFNGDVITGGTFNIQKNVNVTLNNDLYALNVYAGKLNGEVGDESSLKIKKSMIVDNDLTIKATATDISMSNFYGINDKHVTANDDMDKARNSSSIIVNMYKDDTNAKKSSVNINSEAYIMGVAYINTDVPYQTGESIGVKGNYKAYSEEVAKDKEDDLNFTFGTANNPLYLINGKVQSNGDVDPNVSLEDKVKHFVNYWGDKSNLDSGGVQLPKDTSKIRSVGAIVYTDGNETKVSKSSINLEDILGAKIPELQRQYALNVYNLGEKVNGKVFDESTSDDTQKKTLNDLYNTPASRETVIDNFMTLENLTNDTENLKNEQNRGIFNKDSSKRIIIKGNGAMYGTITGATYEAKDGDIVLDATSGKLSAFLATSGDVIIDGEVEFNGNIIAEGNLIVQGTGNKTITSDEEVAKSIQRKAPDIFSKVFKFGGSIEDATSPDEKNLKIDYDLGKFLKNLLWKIIK